MGEKGKKVSRYTGEFKLSAIDEVLNQHKGFRETARKYGVTHKMIQTWIKLYLDKGETYFIGDQPNPIAIRIIRKADPIEQSPTHPPSRRNRLQNLDGLPKEVQAELEQLRMENEYLKKLNALVRKIERSQRRAKSK